MRLQRRNTITGAAALTLVVMVGSGCGAAAKINAVRKSVNNLANGTTGDKKLDALISRFDQGQKAVFLAEYKVTSTGSSAGTKPGVYRVAQKPPKSRFEFGDAGSPDRQIIIDDGVDSFVCAPGQTECLKTPGSGGSGSAAAFGAGAFAFLNPTVFIGAIKSFAPLAGINVATKDFTKSLAGRNADCVQATVSGGGQPTHTSSYCATADGVLAYSDDGSGNIVELTKYDTSVPDSEFVPPKGSTTDPAQAVTGSTLPEVTTTTTSVPQTSTTSAGYGDTTGSTEPTSSTSTTAG